MGLGLAGAAKTPVFFWKLARMNILTIRGGLSTGRRWFSFFDHTGHVGYPVFCSGFHVRARSNDVSTLIGNANSPVATTSMTSEAVPVNSLAAR